MSERPLNEIIEAYKTLFPFRQASTTITTIEQLERSIRIELLDELTHPRVRKTPSDKLQIAIDRIEKSDISDILKVQLIQLYNTVFESVNTF